MDSRYVGDNHEPKSGQNGLVTKREIKSEGDPLDGGRRMGAVGLFCKQENELYLSFRLLSGCRPDFFRRVDAWDGEGLGSGMSKQSVYTHNYYLTIIVYVFRCFTITKLNGFRNTQREWFMVFGKTFRKGVHILTQRFSKRFSTRFKKEANGIDKFETELTTLHPILTKCCVIKSDLELALIQFSNDISSEAHVEVMRKVRAGMKEYQLESMFLHHTYMYGGCRHCSYTCICATGGNSVVLHYGHAAAPNDRTFEDGNMALLDMGAEYNFYGSDITCSFPVNGKFTPDQLLIYNAVLDAHDAVISMMKPGVSWLDMHKLAEKIILESLRGGGVLVGNVDDMMAERVGAIFMPHGLGHLLGLDTHDPGGYTKGMQRPKEPGLKSLRTTRELQAGMVITVEPSCYFIDDLLVPAMESSNTTEFFNREVIARFKGFGGVRIESDLAWLILVKLLFPMNQLSRWTCFLEGKKWLPYKILPFLF
ncbi:hypothetical protein UlMin_039666 [Ulmus minor]